MSTAIPASGFGDLVLEGHQVGLTGPASNEPVLVALKHNLPRWPLVGMCQDNSLKTLTQDRGKTN